MGCSFVSVRPPSYLNSLCGCFCYGEQRLALMYVPCSPRITFLLCFVSAACAYLTRSHAVLSIRWQWILCLYVARVVFVCYAPVCVMGWACLTLALASLRASPCFSRSSGEAGLCARRMWCWLSCFAAILAVRGRVDIFSKVFSLL